MSTLAPARDTRPSFSRAGFVYTLEMAGAEEYQGSAVIGLIPDLDVLASTLARALPEQSLEEVSGPDVCGCFTVSVASEDEPEGIEELLLSAFAAAVAATGATRLRETMSLTLWIGDGEEMREADDFEDYDEALRVAEHLAHSHADVRLAPTSEDWRDYPRVEGKAQERPLRRSSLSG